MKKVNNNEILWAKVKEGAKIPTKRVEDAGYDIYACFDEDYIEIKPHETKMIPTGLASACSDDYVFVLRERGSNGSKGVAQRCGVIDSGYRNEWFVPLTNTTNKPLYIVKKECLYSFLRTRKFEYKNNVENKNEEGVVIHESLTSSLFDDIFDDKIYVK